MRPRPLVATIATALILSACHAAHRDGDRANGQSVSDGKWTDADRTGSDDNAKAGSDDQSAAKLDGYIKGYNALVGTFGLNQQLQQYAGQQIARKTVNDPVFVLPGWLPNGLDDLKKARAMPGTAGNLDAAGDRLLPVLDRLVSELKGLQSYYQSRGQLADNFARGKREDPQVLADFRAAITANDQLSAAIDQEQGKRDAAVLADLKSQGDTIGYDGALALQKSKQLVNLFNSPADMRDPARLAHGDALVATISGALADERAALAKSKGASDPEHGLRNSMYDSAAERLDGMIGAYRDLRRSGNPIFYQSMIASYNGAIDQANMGQIG